MKVSVLTQKDKEGKLRQFQKAKKTVCTTKTEGVELEHQNIRASGQNCFYQFGYE